MAADGVSDGYQVVGSLALYPDDSRKASELDVGGRPMVRLGTLGCIRRQ